MGQRYIRISDWANRALIASFPCRSYETSPEIGGICIAAKAAAQECRESLEELSRRVQKYDAHFQKDGSGSVMKDAAMKFRWHLCERGIVVKFRDTIALHSNALSILLASANV